MDVKEYERRKKKLFELESKYNVLLPSNKFGESLFDFYDKTGFLTPKQVDACSLQKAIAYSKHHKNPYERSRKRKGGWQGGGNGQWSDMDIAWASAHDHGSQ